MPQHSRILFVTAAGFVSNTALTYFANSEEYNKRQLQNGQNGENGEQNGETKLENGETKLENGETSSAMDITGVSVGAVGSTSSVDNNASMSSSSNISPNTSSSTAVFGKNSLSSEQPQEYYSSDYNFVEKNGTGIASRIPLAVLYANYQRQCDVSNMGSNSTGDCVDVSLQSEYARVPMWGSDFQNGNDMQNSNELQNKFGLEGKMEGNFGSMDGAW